MRRPWRRLRRIVALVVLVLLIPVLYSYVTTMMKPSSLPLSIRSIEWVRANHGAWLVNDVERIWYSWHKPATGGAALKTLPTLPIPPPRRHVVAPRVAIRHFLPARIVSPIRPALAGEGVWRTAGWLGGGSPIRVTVFRPDPTYPRVVAYVAWLDHTRTRLALYPGRYEPPHADPRGPMEVPPQSRSTLLATFNSGFTYDDGHGGFALGGHTFEPLKPGIGTVVEYRNGRVDLVSWRGAEAASTRVALARQNLPLIVRAGKPNPNLNNDGSQWGYTLGNAILVWRSGLGIDRRGNLIYAAADNQTVGTLARLLIRAGAVRAIELDINAEWPSFIAYAGRGGLDPVKLVPNSQQPATRYLNPDDRDFFAVFAK